MIPIDDHIAANKRKTAILMVLLVIIFVFLLSLLSGFLVGEFNVFSVVIIFIISVGVFSFFHFKGKDVLAKMAGARKATEESEPYLWHTTESLSISAGIDMPDLYVIETYTPNAFAAGRCPESSSIAVTRGLIERLNRSELEAVLAHEMAHIKNYDIRIATIAATVVMVISIIARMKMPRRSVGRRRSTGRGNGLLLLIVIIALIASKMIKYSISREREYLADAKAAELTMHPEALISALQKLGDENTGKDEKLNNDALEGLFIVSPLNKDAEEQKGFLAQQFSTHPPVEDRIERLKEMS